MRHRSPKKVSKSSRGKENVKQRSTHPHRRRTVTSCWATSRSICAWPTRPYPTAAAAASGSGFAAACFEGGGEGPWLEAPPRLQASREHETCVRLDQGTSLFPLPRVTQVWRQSRSSHRKWLGHRARPFIWPISDNNKPYLSRLAGEVNQSLLEATWSVAQSCLSFILIC